MWLWDLAVEEPVEEQGPRVLIVFGKVQDARPSLLEIAVDDLTEVWGGAGEDYLWDGVGIAVWLAFADKDGDVGGLAALEVPVPLSVLGINE